jgi:RNA polymerase sigma-B factor
MTQVTQAPSTRRPCPEHLVREHMPLARSLALRYRDRGESVEDLVQVAYLGLVKAAGSYQAGRGPNFEAYAVPTVTGELRRHFRDHGWDVRPPRRLQELRSRLGPAEEDLRQELGREPTVTELAGHLEVSPADVREVRSASDNYHALSLDAPPPGEDADGWTGSVADLHGRDPSDDDVLDGVVDASAVAPLLAGLEPRDQLIIALRYYRGCTQQQIAERIGVTQMQVSRLLSQVLERLRAQVLADAQAAGRAKAS